MAIALVPVFSEEVERGAPPEYLVICDIYFVGGVIGSVLTIPILETALVGEYERNTGFRRLVRRHNPMTSRISHHGELTSVAEQSAGSLSC